MSNSICIFWFRRDLRLDDNAGLYQALKSGLPVLPVFIFDKNILDKLENKEDQRVEFIHQAISSMNDQLQKYKSSIRVFHSTPANAFKDLIHEYEVKAVYTNHDYETYAIDRDHSIAAFLKKNGISFHTFKDQVIFEKDEILKDDGKPYTIFTPYSRKWKAKLDDFYLKSYPCKKYYSRFLQKK